MQNQVFVVPMLGIEVQDMTFMEGGTLLLHPLFKLLTAYGKTA